MPIEIPRTPAADETIRIRFVRNKSYAGCDYGPDYPEQTADVRADWAKHFVTTGAAERVAAPAAPAAAVETAQEPEVVPKTAKPKKAK